MSVQYRHPQYAIRIGDFQTARDTIEGERNVKGIRLTAYLPVPPGLSDITGHVTLNSYTGQRNISGSRYAFYSSFAEFPELPGPTIEAFQGLVHRKKPRVELPEDMKYLLRSATPSGDTLQNLWEMQTRELFSVGRFVFLGEIDEESNEVVLCPYVCESLINWQASTKRDGTTTTMSVLHDVEYQFKKGEQFEQELVSLYRELRLRTSDGQAEDNGPGATYQVRRWKAEGSDAYTATTSTSSASVVTDDSTDPDGWIEVMRLGTAYDFIPMVVSNTHETGLEYGRIPILPISRISLSIFRLTADYKRALYIKGDPQCVIYGIDKNDAPETIGGSEIWVFENENAKSEYMDLDGDGIPMMRQAINDDFERYVQAAGRLLEHSQRNGQESGVAVEKRMNGQHVTVASVVIKAAEAMETALRMVGRMMGKSEEELGTIRFVPNTDFVESTLTGQELLQLVGAKNMGAPLSTESIHTIMRKGQLTEKTFDEEQELIDSEPPPVTGLLPSPAEEEPSDEEEDETEPEE